MLTVAVSWDIRPRTIINESRLFSFAPVIARFPTYVPPTLSGKMLLHSCGLNALQRLLWYIQVYEKQFDQEQMERFGLQEKKELTAKRRELDKARQRVIEIDRLIQKSYEDMAKGLLSEERFATLTVSLENEQKQLKADIPELEASLNATADKADDLQKFIQRARQVTRLTELTPEIVHEFIEKIVVSKPDKVDGKRHQRVDIHYNTIGLWTAPDPETMEREYLSYCRAMKKRKKKTA